MFHEFGLEGELDAARECIDCYYCSFDRFLISVLVSLIFVVAAGTFVAPKAVIIIIIIAIYITAPPNAKFSVNRLKARVLPQSRKSSYFEVLLFNSYSHKTESLCVMAASKAHFLSL